MLPKIFKKGLKMRQLIMMKRNITTLDSRLSNNILSKLNEFSVNMENGQKELKKLSSTDKNEEILELKTKLKKLRPFLEKLQYVEEIDKKVKDLKDMKKSKDCDKEMKEIVEEELEELDTQKEKILMKILKSWRENRPKSKYAAKIYIGIRFSTGGDESGLFAKELFDMYKFYAVEKKWTATTIKYSPIGPDAIRDGTLLIEGDGAERHLAFEQGGHRVQRVPKTSRKGKLHTSIVNVDLIRPREATTFKLKSSDVEVQTIRSSGSGGQNVNKRDTCVRMKHLKTGIEVKCEGERTQHANRTIAYQKLEFLLEEKEAKKVKEEELEEWKGSGLTGKRTDKIRTYNFKHDRVTDHRVNQTIRGVGNILEGKGLDKFYRKLNELELLSYISNLQL